MNKLILFLLCVMFFSNCSKTKKSEKDKIKSNPLALQNTVCNPFDISYRFAIDGLSRREAADPSIVLYKNEYYLFASKSGGYWSSKDLVSWNFITSPDLPFEDYAPTALVMDNVLYFMASNNNAPITIYKTNDPKSGKWDIANDAFPIAMTDPFLFFDEGRLFCYYGCSNKDPLYVVELDKKTLNPIDEPIAIMNSKKEDYGWERWGDYNDGDKSPWIEGAWVNKYKGKYYLQYAGPGTRFKSYNDGLYISENPLGPFTLAKHNPVSYKPEGFVNGAGHGTTFQDKYGNYWHAGTMSLTIKHKFERRIGLFPAFFDEDDVFYTYTGFGDFPYYVPQKKINHPKELATDWMLLSYNKPVEVSSVLPDHPKKMATDEEIRTYWSAKTGNKGEWLLMDLTKESNIHAIQVNFAEHETQLHDRSSNIFHQYLVEYSTNGQTWKTLIDKTESIIDTPHDYTQLRVPVEARYIKITNYRVPDGTFALADLRIFGKGKEEKPQKEPNLVVNRKDEDKCIVKLNWEGYDKATGYNIRYGIALDKLYHNYQVIDSDSLTIRTLNKFEKYYFTIDVFNENGVLRGKNIVEVE
ncbi:family 43 glycosylhydrolase [Aquimarina aggregata]|uniref:family 43 glycosylhydrolase n=1 Tax=Aquimarina aggregata TaxID=1642818 RepID=UPI00248FE53D|nr:family 43 glycosylhydrolase [Aquimarina aggregata]